MTPPREAPASFDPAEMQRLLDGPQAATRQRVREILSCPSFRYLPVTASIEEQRAAALRWCQELAEEGVGLLAVPEKYGGQGDFAAFMAAFETIAFHDLGMTIKFTVQFGIWLGSVLLLGSERQHAELLHRIGTLELPGCFAMTEIGHGSNVRELETTATYDPASEEFVVNSPTWAAGKNYIGNGACHGRLATVFAQFETQGAARGVHALLVPLRDEAGNVLPGVRIEDNGPKMGENGVDNARIWFENVRVGRGALLDRFGQVEADGGYRSGIASAGARFFATISALVGGRLSIALAGLSAAKSGLAIAVKYATRRRQFRAPGAAEETALLDYPTHQRRLLPLLANAYAVDFLLKDLVRRRAETLAEDTGGGAAAGVSRQDDKALSADGEERKTAEQEKVEKRRELELLAAGTKAWATWNTTRTLQTCRECCGGEGYMSINRLPALKADSDIFTTFEGDNTVLMLWVGRQLLAEHERAGGNGRERAPVQTPRVAAGNGWASTQSLDKVGSGFLPGEPAYEELFASRAEGTLEDISADLANLADKGIEGHGAMAGQQIRLLDAAHAHIERMLLERFVAVVAAQPEGSLRRVLGQLCELFALTQLEMHRGWLLERRLMPEAMSLGLSNRVEALCRVLATQAETLVEAFGIPAQCLAAPIAGV